MRVLYEGSFLSCLQGQDIRVDNTFPFGSPENKAFQKSGLHSFQITYLYMCVLVLKLIVELTEQ